MKEFSVTGKIELGTLDIRLTYRSSHKHINFSVLQILNSTFQSQKRQLAGLNTGMADFNFHLTIKTIDQVEAVFLSFVRG